MTAGAAFPGGLTEAEFLEAYWRSALRAPQVVADSALRAATLATNSDRLLLVGFVAGQLAEACRRLVAVWDALADRRYPVARSLLAPLPDAARWALFVDEAGRMAPEQMLRHLSLGDDAGALDAARKLRGEPALAELAPLVEAHAGGAAMVLVRGNEWHRPDTEPWYSGLDAAGTPLAWTSGGDEGAAAGLADLTAELVAIARGLLGAYVAARLSAGRRE